MVREGLRPPQGRLARSSPISRCAAPGLTTVRSTLSFMSEDCSYRITDRGVQDPDEIRELLKFLNGYGACGCLIQPLGGTRRCTVLPRVLSATQHVTLIHSTSHTLLSTTFCTIYINPIVREVLLLLWMCNMPMPLSHELGAYDRPGNSLTSHCCFTGHKYEHVQRVQ